MSEGGASPQPPSKAGTAQAVKAVFWSFLGIRRRRDYEDDAAKLTPVQVVVTGLVMGLLFVLSVLLVVRLVLAT